MILKLTYLQLNTSSNFTKMSMNKLIISTVRYLKNDPGYFIKYLRYYIFPWPKLKQVIFFKESETLNILNEGKSIIRIGDGEIGLLHNRGVFYQEYSNELSSGLKELITDYSVNSPYVLAIPKYINYSKNQLKNARGGLKCWLSLIVTFNELFPKNVQYANAHIFYHEELFKDFFKKLGRENKTLIFITNRIAIESLMENVSNQEKVIYIEAPLEHSFRELKEINSDIENAIKNSINPILIFSCGPAGKISTFKFAKKGIPSYDIGFGLKYFYDDVSYSTDLPKIDI